MCDGFCSRNGYILLSYVKRTAYKIFGCTEFAIRKLRISVQQKKAKAAQLGIWTAFGTRKIGNGVETVTEVPL